MERSTDIQQSQSTTRRAFLMQLVALTGVSAGTALLAACGAASTTATAVPVAQQPTTAPTMGAVSTTAATEGATTGVASTTAATTGATAGATSGTAATSETTAGAATPQTTAAATTGQSATPAIVAAVNAFLATLDETQRTAVSFPYPTDQKTATAANFGFRVGEQFGDSVWSNYPVSDVIRPGLKMGDLTDAQRQAAQAVLVAMLSAQGYQKVLNIMHADQLLSEGGTNYASGEANYLIGIFGTPSDSARWMVQYGGHHLGLNVTIQGATMTMAPTLTGCQPSTYTRGGQTIRPLGGETDKAFALINAMDATQQKQAILSYAVTDLVLGPGQDGKVLQPEGIPAASLNADQQTMLLELAGEWVNILNDAAAQAKMADIKAHIAETYFAWSGDTAVGSSVYFRITGPTVLIEFANQGSLGGGPGGGGPGGAPNGTPGAGPNGTPGTGANGTPGTGANGTPDMGANGTPGMGANGTPGTGANGTPGTSSGSGQQNPLETGGVNHIHTVYRDPTNDYGTGLS